MDVNVFPGDLCKIERNDRGFAYPVYEQNFVDFRVKTIAGAICSHHIFLIISSSTIPGDAYTSYYILSNFGICGWIYEPAGSIIKI